MLLLLLLSNWCCIEHAPVAADAAVVACTSFIAILSTSPAASPSDFICCITHTAAAYMQCTEPLLLLMLLLLPAVLVKLPHGSCNQPCQVQQAQVCNMVTPPVQIVRQLGLQHTVQPLQDASITAAMSAEHPLQLLLQGCVRY
jgi:hypothetical protein